MINVLLDADDTLLKSPVSLLFNIYLSTHLAPTLYNEISREVVHVAQVKRTNINPANSSVFTMDRAYALTEIESGFTIPGSAIESIRRMANVLQGRDVSARNDMIGGRIRTTDKADVEERALASYILRQLESNISAAAYRTKVSLDKGVVAQVRSILRRSSMPAALCEVISELSTSIASSVERISDANIWARQEKLRTNLINQYVRESMRVAYGLAKEPGTFVADLYGIVNRHLHNLTTDNTNDSRYTTIVGENGEKLQLVAYMAVSDCFIPNMKSGTRETSQPVYLQPNEVFRKDTAGSERVELMYDATFPRVDEVPNTGNGDDTFLLATRETDDPRTIDNRASAIIRLAAIGSDVYGQGIGLTDVAKRDTMGPAGMTQSRMSQHALYTATSNTPCRYIDVPGGVMIVETLHKEAPRADYTNIDLHEHTASMVYRRDEMMRVSVGDYDPRNKFLVGWANSITNGLDSRMMCDPRRMFATKNVSMRTPGVVLHERHMFTCNELALVFLQPHLHDASPLVDALNHQLVTVSERGTSQTIGISKIYHTPLRGVRRQQRRQRPQHDGRDCAG